jgi:hypothetical protein
VAAINNPADKKASYAGAKIIVANGANVNFAPPSSDSVLHEAVHSGDLELVRTLLFMGKADRQRKAAPALDSRDMGGKPAVHICLTAATDEKTSVSILQALATRCAVVRVALSILWSIPSHSSPVFAILWPDSALSPPLVNHWQALDQLVATL